MSDVDAKIGHLLNPWLAPQAGLPKVLRWSRFYEQGNRRQDAGLHSISILFLGMMVLDRIGNFQPGLDRPLIVEALAVHDFGEGELRRDISWPDKGPEHDVAEYEAFMRLVRANGLDKSEMQARFLLQFALKGSEHHAHFPGTASTVLAGLASYAKAEARMFEAIEYLDHMLYIAEQIREGGKLAEVFAGEIHTVIDVLTRCAKEIPGFHTVWTPELDAWARSLMPAR